MPDNGPKNGMKWKFAIVICSLALMSFLSMNGIKNKFLITKHGKMQNVTPGTYIDQDGICVNALPYATLHHKSLQEEEAYIQFHIHKAGGVTLSYSEDNFPSYGDVDPPELRTLPPGSSFAFWDHCNKRDDCAFPTSIVNIEGSAWTADGEDAFTQKKHEDIWVPHSDHEHLGTKTTILKGDTAAMFGFFSNNFGHVLHDNFPLLAWLKDSVPQHTRFVLPDTVMYRDLIDFIDPHFSERIYFFQSNEIITVEEGTLTVANPKTGKFLGAYGNTLLRHMRHWIYENHPETYPEDEKHIIFYVRGGEHTHHGRQLEKQHEQDVLAIIKSKMKKYNRKEKLLLFTGMDEEGNILPYNEQFNIFRHASTIIGPHGSGLANVVWTDPFPRSCKERVQMLEFIAGTDAKKVQNPVFNGYYWVLRGMPIDWHQIAYASNSTQQTTYLHLDDLQRALDDMWG